MLLNRTVQCRNIHTASTAVNSLNFHHMVISSNPCQRTHYKSLTWNVSFQTTGRGISYSVPGKLGLSIVNHVKLNHRGMFTQIQASKPGSLKITLKEDVFQLDTPIPSLHRLYIRVRQLCLMPEVIKHEHYLPNRGRQHYSYQKFKLSPTPPGF